MSVAHHWSPAAVSDHARRPRPAIALLGTFDVDNYGDHLFPLVARHELARRLPWADLRPAAPYGRLHPTRFDLCDVAPLPPWDDGVATSFVESHVAVVIGGGEILHLNDRLLAPVYGAAGDELAALRPSGWFVDTALRSTPRQPVAWNAVGIPDHLDEDGRRRVAAAASAAAYVAVRDRASAARLRDMRVHREVHVVPDTGLLVDRVFDDAVLAARARATRRIVGRGRRSIAVQGCDLLVPHVDGVARALRRWLTLHPDVVPVVLETGRGRGDHLFGDALQNALGGRVVRMAPDTDAAGTAAAIRSSVAFVGSSLHGAITAKTFGVPFVTLNLAGEAKLDGCAEWFGATGGVVSDASSIEDALGEVTGAPPDVDHVRSLQHEVDLHFDRIAALVAAAHRAQPLRPRRVLGGVGERLPRSLRGRWSSHLLRSSR